MPEPTMIAPLPDNEAARLAALHRYDILDTEPEQDFDDITLLAAQICGTPIALISLVDENRQWFKSKVGMTEVETSRDIAFCAHGILQEGVFEVADALADKRFATNPLVTGKTAIRFYAGAPLVAPDGHTLGMLCVQDQVPHLLSPDQKLALQALSRQVVAQLEVRHSLKELRHHLIGRTAMEASLRDSEERFRFLNDLSEATRTLADPAQIMAVTSRLLGGHLRACRCAYADVAADGEEFTILHDYTDGCDSTVGHYQLSLFGPQAATLLHSGQTLVIRDVGAELAPGAGAEMFRAIGIQAIICCPLVKGGTLRAMMAMHQTTPRDWQPGEIALVQDVVERCWAAIERRSAEESLRQGEALLRIAGRTAQLGGWALDLPDRRVTWSDEVSDIHEMPRGTVPSLQQALDHYLPQSREAVSTALAACLSEGTPFDLELEMLTAQGRPLWVRCAGEALRSADGTILRAHGAFQDITQHKQDVEALRASKRFAVSIAENSPNLIYIFDLETGRNVYTNRNAAESLGYSQAQILAMGDDILPTLIHADDLSRVTQHFAHFADVPDQRIVDLEYRLRHFNGETRWIWARDAVFTRRPDGSAWQIMGTAQDVTARKRAEAELALTHRELLEKSRLAGMAEVATGVLHNVGNVLTSVNVASSCLADSLRNSKAVNLAKVVALLREHAEDLGDYLTRDPRGMKLPGYLAQLADHLASEQATALTELAQLQKNIGHIKDIVNMQQGFAKVSGLVETLPAADLMHEALRMNAGSLSRHDISVIREFDDVPAVTVERPKVLQILVNLMHNAKHACDDSGRLDKRLTLRLTSDAWHVFLSVGDNGVGIAPENLTRIFAHGFTTKKSGHGFGLHSGALAAREMGGALSVHSAGPGLGATFTLALPCPLPEESARLK